MTYKLIFSLTLLFSTVAVAQKSPIVIDQIVAQIGDKFILLSDIQSQKLQMIQAKMDVTETSDCTILEDLMYQNLMLNQALLDSIVVQDAQVDGEMENRLRVIENQIGGKAKMEAFYGKSTTQIKEEFREIIRDRLLTQEMERIITEDISVTPKEVQAFYNKLPKDSIPLINATLSFQQIVIYPEITKSDKKLAYDQMVQIRKDIISGKSFETQARINSMDPGSAKDGGRIEATRGMMVPQFEATVYKLKEGEVSDVFETDYGYHIVKLVDRKGDDYVCKHILIIPQFANSELEKAAYRMDTCYAELQSGELSWDQAVQKYSNDEATKQNKGIITNPMTGEQTWSTEDLNEIDQQIYLLTDALEMGQYSTPNLYANFIERKQGIRIVRLMNRTEPHVANMTDDYALIKRAAENQKKEDALKNWAAGKIGGAYISINEEYRSCDFRNQWIAK
jgi:peptidyl-prolyl cis-trans isomerase SurA|tara:strand:+ start:46418 stop:47770 length:1353 start_codon:yes stop_codon:yes gene_type:complete